MHDAGPGALAQQRHEALGHQRRRERVRPERLDQLRSERQVAGEPTLALLASTSSLPWSRTATEAADVTSMASNDRLPGGLWNSSVESAAVPLDGSRVVKTA